jgi:multidrug efflux pump subunit AcrA (membrane-fusion protein)
LTEFATAADPATRTFAATFNFDNPSDVTVHTGMTAKVTVHVRASISLAAGLSVPSLATAADEGGAPYVWVVDPTSLAVSRRSVVLGQLSGKAVQVREGLEGNEWIAISGVHHLREGMVVRRQGK